MRELLLRLTIVVLLASQALSQSSPVMTGPVHDPQHAALMLTVPRADATVVVTGAQSLSAILTSRTAPYRIWIESGGELLVDGEFSHDSQIIDWIGGEGLLHFPPGMKTHLRVKHVALDRQGGIRVGDVAGTTRTSLGAADCCRITLEPRGRWYDDGSGNTGYWTHVNDPNDISGGLCSAGEWTLLGAIKARNVQPVSAKAGQTALTVDRSEGWLPGDELLIPGLLRGSKQHELRRIVSICRTTAGEQVTLDAPLQFDHTLPDGLAVRVSNLTCNIVIEGAETADVRQRSHTVIHHVSGGTVSQGVRFQNMGRTSPKKLFTAPGQNLPDDKINTNGRYNFHVHDEDFQGAVDGFDNPHVVQSCVSSGALKHAFVNHGALVRFDDCTAYDFGSSGFMSENGNEVYAVARCSAVKGTQPTIPLLQFEDRRMAGDPAFRGTGYWSQSPMGFHKDNFYADVQWAGHEQEFRPLVDSAILKGPDDIPNYCHCPPELKASHKLEHPWLGRHDVTIKVPWAPKIFAQFIDTHVDGLRGTGATVGFSTLYNRTSRSEEWMGWSTYRRLRLYNCDLNGILGTYSHFQDFDDLVLHASAAPISSLTFGVNGGSNFQHSRWNNLRTQGFNTPFFDPRWGYLRITNSTFDRPVTLYSRRLGNADNLILYPPHLMKLDLSGNQGEIRLVP